MKDTLNRAPPCRLSLELITRSHVRNWCKYYEHWNLIVCWMNAILKIWNFNFWILPSKAFIISLLWATLRSRVSYLLVTTVTCIIVCCQPCYSQRHGKSYTFCCQNNGQIKNGEMQNEHKKIIEKYPRRQDIYIYIYIYIYIIRPCWRTRCWSCGYRQIKNCPKSL